MTDTADIRVTYIISTRNRAEYLDRTLDNVREFITPQDELLIMDGDSTDDTSKVVEKHRDIVARFQSEPDSGEAHGFNKGMLLARGDIIKPLTDDDYIYPEAMRQAITVMEAHPELDAMLCGGELTERDPKSGEDRATTYCWLPPSLRLQGNILGVTHVTCGIGLLFRRSMLSRVGLFDTAYRAVDTEYHWRLVLAGVDFRYLDVKLFRHFTWPHSGVNVAHEVMRDRIRVRLRAREWDRLMEREDLPLTEVGDALGLKDLSGGDELMEIIWHADRIRKTRRPFVLKTLLGCVKGMLGVLDACSGMKRAIWGRKAPNANEDVEGPPPYPTSEPNWKGILR